VRIGSGFLPIFLLFFLCLFLISSDAFCEATFITVDELANRLGMTCQKDSTTYRQTLTDGANEVVICPGLYNVLVNDEIITLEERAANRWGRVIVPESAFASIRAHLNGRRAAAPVQVKPVFVGKPKVVIDPGHGGKDPGAIGVGGLLEKDVNLRIGLMLRDKLRQMGYRVIMTREDDTFIELEERAAVANRVGADLFISIHANSSRSPSARGVETYYVDDRGPYSATARAMMALRSAQSSPPSQVLGTDAPLTGLAKAVLYGALLEEFRKESRELALAVQSSLSGILGVPNRGAHGNKGLRVLRYSRCPGILVEVGFLSNPQTAAKLRSSAYCDRIAGAIASAVNRYFERLKATAWFTK